MYKVGQDLYLALTISNHFRPFYKIFDPVCIWLILFIKNWKKPRHIYLLILIKYHHQKFYNFLIFSSFIGGLIQINKFIYKSFLFISKFNLFIFELNITSTSQYKTCSVIVILFLAFFKNHYLTIIAW